MVLHLLLAVALGLFTPNPPPPPPSPPGVGCSGEQIYTGNLGSISVTFGNPSSLNDPQAKSCAFLLRTGNAGVTLTFSRLQLLGQGTVACQPEAAHLRVYDGSTTFARMLASYTCSQHWQVGSTGGDVLVVFTADAQHSGEFQFSWQPSAPVCGNGICEPSADEYDLCALDCMPEFGRTPPLPALSLQHHDTKCARTHDRAAAIHAARAARHARRPTHP